MKKDEKKYQIIQGDCLEVLKELSDNSVDMVLANPPYNIGKDKKLDKWKKQEDYVHIQVVYRVE